MESSTVPLAGQFLLELQRRNPGPVLWRCGFDGTMTWWGDWVGKPGRRKDGLYGLAAQVPYVEPYIFHKPPVFDHLPVSKYHMDIAPGSHEEMLHYSGQMLLR